METCEGVACFRGVIQPRPRSKEGAGLKRHQIFDTSYVRPNGLTYSTKFGTETRSVFYGGQPRLHIPRRRAPSPIFGTVGSFVLPNGYQLQRQNLALSHAGSVFLGGQPRPRPKGGAQRPPNFWDLLHGRTQYEKEPYCIAIKLDKANLYTFNHEC